MHIAAGNVRSERKPGWFYTAGFPRVKRIGGARIVRERGSRTMRA
jgi:hypothetical protein